MPYNSANQENQCDLGGMMLIVERILAWIAVLAFLTFRVLGPLWIGRAARKRNEGFGVWIVVGVIIGPIITYLL